MNLTEMTRHGLAGQSATREEALQVLDSSNDELLSVIAAAGKIRRHFFGNRVRLNYLVNLKSGMCPEDCSYCSQRLGSQAEIRSTPGPIPAPYTQQSKPASAEGPAASAWWPRVTAQRS